MSTLASADLSKIEEHSWAKTLILHLLPGALITIFFYLFGPLVVSWGFPSIMALMLAILFVLVPFELGVLLYQGYQANHQFSLREVVLFREKIPTWQYFVLVPLLLVWGFLVFAALSPLDDYLVHNVFNWLPGYFFTSTFINDLSQYSQTSLTITLISAFGLNGFIGPIVEELYFRGYLLPRLGRMKAWAPLVNVLLFSMYHFFSPWQNLTRILALIPLVYVVWWKRNIYLSMFTHVILNTTGMLLLLPMILNSN